MICTSPFSMTFSDCWTLDVSATRPPFTPWYSSCIADSCYNRLHNHTKQWETSSTFYHMAWWLILCRRHCHRVASSGRRGLASLHHGPVGWPDCLSPEVGRNRSSVVAELVCPACARTARTMSPEEMCGLLMQIRSNSWIRGLTADGFFRGRCGRGLTWITNHNFSAPRWILWASLMKLVQRGFAAASV